MSQEPKPPLVYSCSGASRAAPMAHDIAIRLDRLKVALRSSISGVGGDVGVELDTDAFLDARTSGWEDLTRIPEHANVFFEGTYVGQSFLNVQSTSDTLDVSLGRDKGVVVERIRRKRTDDKAAIGGKRTINVCFDINVRNTKARANDIEVSAQHPLRLKIENK